MSAVWPADPDQPVCATVSNQARRTIADRDHNLNNTQRITLASFLAYFIMAAMLSPIGIISGPMAEYFDEPVTAITAGFSWLTVGILVGAIAALFVLEWFRLKTLMLCLYACIVACLVSLTLHDQLALIRFALGCIGVCCGLGLAGAALTISRTYSAERRASMLVITDSSFSIGGFACSLVAAYLVAQGFHWSGVYQFVAVVAAIVMMLAATSGFPATYAVSGPGDDSGTTRWPAGVWLCLVALLLYTLGQSAILLWIPNYAGTALGAAADEAGLIVSRFWSGMFLAQLLVSWWVTRVGVRRVLWLAAGGCTLMSIPMWMLCDVGRLQLMAFAWGFSNLALLKVVLSFGTQLVPVPTARLVSGLLLGATCGTAVSPWLTSQVVELGDNHRVLQFGTACFVTMSLLLLAATRLHRAHR